MEDAPPRRAAYTFIFITILLDSLAFGMIIPVLPKLVESFMGGDAGKAAQIYGLFGTIWALMQLISMPIIGALSDRYGRKPAMLWPRVALMLLTYPLFLWLIADTSFTTLTITTLILAGLTGMSAAPTVVAIPEQFPMPIRALGLSVVYAVGVAVFGGSAQAIVTWLIAVTGSPAAPALYVVASSIITVIAIVLTPETGGKAELRH